MESQDRPIKDSLRLLLKHLGEVDASDNRVLRRLGAS
mgnify:CR=1 FL=1